MKVAKFLIVLFFSVQTFAQVEGNPENWCRNGLFPRETGEFRIAKIKGAKNERAYFYKDEDDCPNGKSCREKSYVIAGDEVIVARNYGQYSCSWYQPKKGAETVGWILTEQLELAESKDFELKDWLGDWKYYDNSIVIGKSKTGRDLEIKGDALWKGLGDNVHVGEIEAVEKPNGGEITIGEESDGEYDCRVTLRLVGKFLIATDNLNCGGANVTFNGVYRRK